MKIDTSILIIGILFRVKFAFGYWLNHTGKSYSAAILAAHKLVSLFTAIYIGLTAYRMHNTVGLNSTDIVMVVVTELLFLIAIVTGGILSTDKPTPTFITIIHKVTPFLSVIMAATTMYIVFGI